MHNVHNLQLAAEIGPIIAIEQQLDVVTIRGRRLAAQETSVFPGHGPPNPGPGPQAQRHLSPGPACVIIISWAGRRPGRHESSVTIATFPRAPPCEVCSGPRGEAGVFTLSSPRRSPGSLALPQAPGGTTPRSEASSSGPRPKMWLLTPRSSMAALCSVAPTLV